MLSSNNFKSQIVKSVIIGNCVTIISSLLVLVVFAVALTNIALPDSAVLIMSLISFGIGSFIGGIFSAKIYKEKGYIIGALNGFVFFILSTMTSIAVNPEPLTKITIIKLLIIVLASSIGGILGVNISRKNKF